MALRQVIEKVFGGVSAAFLDQDETEKKVKDRDWTPVEVSPRLGVGGFSSMEDMRRIMETLSREKAAAGGETFEEFWNFGGDDEFVDLESMPAPAQMRAHALLESFTTDFKTQLDTEAKKRKETERERLKEELRKELGEELAKVHRNPPEPA